MSKWHCLLEFVFNLNLVDSIQWLAVLNPILRLFSFDMFPYIAYKQSYPICVLQATIIS